MPEAAETTTAEGTSPEVSTDLGATSTEGAGNELAANSPAEEPILYTVKVGGKEEKVTFEELQNGYTRQADYTRKTQELAGERQRLAQVQTLADALERDFQGTVRELAKVAGLTFGQAAQAAQQIVDGDEDDPILAIKREIQGLTQQLTARDIAERDARQTQAQQETVKAQIERELSDLHESYGDFPDIELVEYAVAHGLNNLAAAYRAWQFDALDSQRIAEQNAAIEAKRRAQVVASGPNSAAGTVTRGAAGQKMTVLEAWNQAKAHHK